MRAPLRERAFYALKSEAARVGWPLRFATDLTTHDRAYLAQHDDAEPFAWVLMTDGTILTYPSRRPIDGAGTMAHIMPRIVCHTFGAENCRWYWWDGNALINVRSAADLGALLRASALDRLPCPHCGDGSCVLCDDNGTIPAH